MKKKSVYNGFTLIELMVVIVIIGLLVAIALPNFIASQQRARVSSLKSNAKTLQISVETYNIDYQVYPNRISAITSSKTYKTFRNPFTGFEGLATSAGLSGAWRTNDDGATNASSDLISYGDKDKSKGLVIYVGLDNSGAATTQFTTADGENSSNTNPTDSYLIYACDDEGKPVRSFLLNPGVLPDKQETKDFVNGNY